LSVPLDYSAQLETGTVSGEIDVGFPMMVPGKIGRSLSVTLGESDATVRAVTTNGEFESDGPGVPSAIPACLRRVRRSRDLPICEGALMLAPCRVY
jgi:hypothetical protein